MVCMVAANLDIPSRPPAVIDCSREERRYDHQVVTLPVPCKGHYDDAPSDNDGATRSSIPPNPHVDVASMNTAMMLTILGFKGYQMISETRGDIPYTTKITLRRKAPICKGIEMLARQSPMFQKVLQAA